MFSECVIFSISGLFVWPIELLNIKLTLKSRGRLNKNPPETTVRKSFSHRRMIIWEFHVATKKQIITT